jgi:ABC-type antimicrobial peptide transport system permease subunit
VSRVRTQLEINRAQTVRERLLAKPARFFGIVAAVLPGVGLYGVLHYSVLERQREIGIRMAIGARVAAIVRMVTVDVFLMVLVGAAAGLTAGLALARYMAALVYEVKPTDLPMLAFPWLARFGTAVLASPPPVVRAARSDPVRLLRAE